MSVSSWHILRQRAPVAGLARVALASMTAPIRRRLSGENLQPSDTAASKTVAPPSRKLVEDYLEHVGADPADYARLIPPHLFPQWSFDLIGRTLSHLTLPLHAAVNGGCRLEVNGLLPASEPLEVSARLVEVDERPHKITLDQQITTGPAAAPRTLVAHMYTVLVRGRSENSEDDAGETSNAGPAVPAGGRRLQRLEIPEDAGLDFAKLTGDFNPIHWLRPAATAAGFDNTILHGFGTMARAWETLRREAGVAPDGVADFDIRFTRPLVLPAEPGVWVAADEDEDETADAIPSSGTIAVGDAPGDRPYLIGSYRLAGTGKGEP